MKSIEMEGKTVEDALDKALKELNLTKEQVEFEVLEHGSKGLFNVIGAKRARIKVTEKYTYLDDARKFIKNILNSMELEAEIDITEKDDTVNINVTGRKMGLIIGYRGETLDAIQYLVSLVINKHHDIPHKKVILDTENYRSKREATLNNLAKKMADKVKRTKRAFKLEAMNPYERRIIHSALQNDEEIETYSEGSDPGRSVVIALKSE